ncbi:unnamed protein product [Rhizoctonia solani]|uniref:Uncharacterized protein n=1 Tax=Rhizoctonia solani TaxID=456999 RepID=A0A8H2XE82_9AGAM|nr:unnamed protein product [Rhizoctonia solani]
MAFNSKRKFDDAEELVQDTYVPVKHTKVAPITEPMVTEDVDMGSDDAPSPAPSLASLATTASSHNSPAYPHFDLYPFPTSGDGMDSNPAFDSMKHARSDSTVGLMQPQTIASDFVHHGWVSLLAGLSSEDHSPRLFRQLLADPPPPHRLASWPRWASQPLESLYRMWRRRNGFNLVIDSGSAFHSTHLVVYLSTLPIFLTISSQSHLLDLRALLSAVYTPKTTNNFDPTSVVSTNDLLSDNCLGLLDLTNVYSSA